MGRKKKKPASSTSLMVQALVIAQGGRCAYCPREFTDDDIDVDGPATWPTFDHVVPKSRGGSNNIKNGLAACIPCNGKKGNRKPTKAELAILARITPIALPIYVRMRATRMAAAIRQEETEAHRGRRSQARLRGGAAPGDEDALLRPARRSGLRRARIEGVDSRADAGIGCPPDPVLARPLGGGRVRPFSLG